MLELTKPPIIGAATRVIISEPVPIINMIGSNPAIVEQLVIMMMSYTLGCDSDNVFKYFRRFNFRAKYFDDHSLLKPVF